MAYKLNPFTGKMDFYKSVSPPGSDTQVIFNDGGAFGAESDFTYNKTTNTLTTSVFQVGTAYPIKTLSNNNEIVIGLDAASGITGDTSGSLFIGRDAGKNSSNLDGSLILGDGAGINATYDNLGPSPFGSIWLGTAAGAGSQNAYGSLGVGQGALGSSTGYYNSAFGGNAMASCSVTNTTGIGGYCFEFSSGDLNLGIGDYAFQFASASESSGFGPYAAQGASNMSQCLCVGAYAGQSSVNAYVCTFIGPQAGKNSSGLDSCTAVGGNSMQGVYDAQQATAVGNASANGATAADFAVAIGAFAGATYDVYQPNIERSVLVGAYAAGEAQGANDCIFIGYQAGIADTVDNVTTEGWNILIGKNTNTGGFKNSIAIGGYIANSAASQCNIGNAFYIGGIYTANTQSATPVGNANFGFNTDLDFSDGVGVVAINEVSTAPTAAASTCGLLYVESGALKYRGTSGTVTTIAPA